MEYMFHTPLGLKSVTLTPSDEGTHISVRHRLFGSWSFAVALSAEAVGAALDRMRAGALIQDAFPDLNAEQRELFLTNPAHDIFDDRRENCAECGGLCDAVWNGYDGVYCSYPCFIAAEPEGDDDNT
jgi:hypothetical protein